LLSQIYKKKKHMLNVRFLRKKNISQTL